jgi:hypothetical protein
LSRVKVFVPRFTVPANVRLPAAVVVHVCAAVPTIIGTVDPNVIVPLVAASEIPVALPSVRLGVVVPAHVSLPAALVNTSSPTEVAPTIVGAVVEINVAVEVAPGTVVLFQLLDELQDPPFAPVHVSWANAALPRMRLPSKTKQTAFKCERTALCE